MFNDLINMFMIMAVLASFAYIYVGVENILIAMLVHDLVHFIWFILWFPMVFCATISIAHVQI